MWSQGDYCAIPESCLSTEVILSMQVAIWLGTLPARHAPISFHTNTKPYL